MKILRVIASMDPKSGGPCQGIRNTTEALSLLGVQNEVVCLDAPDSPYLGNDSFPIHALGPANNFWAYSAKLFPWLINNIGRFDSVIVHGLWLYPSHAVKNAMKELSKSPTAKSIPWFIMPHGMLDPYFQNTPDRKIKAIRNKYYWKIIENKVVESATGLLFTCEEELLLAKKPFEPYKPKAELNVGYGIQSPPDYSPEMSTAFYEQCELNSDERYLLFLSRIHPKKGIDNLIRAYQKLIESEGNQPIPLLVIAGPGLETSFGEEMRALSESDEMSKNRISFPGMLHGKAKWGAFYGCEAFVLPSHQENFGIAVAEALACAKPVLISDKINIWREITEGKGGLVESDTESGTFALLKNWVNLSLTDKSALSTNAFSTYHRFFKINNNIQTLVKTLEEYISVEKQS